MLSTKSFKSIIDLLKMFPDEKSCVRHLESVRWNGVVVSPFNANSTVYSCKGGRYKCKITDKYFNVKTGTIFEGTKIPLQQWFLAIYLFSSHKKGISSHQLAKDLSITQKTAWIMLSKLRTAMDNDCFSQMMEGTVEVDETFVGGKNKNRHWDKKVANSQGRSFKDKTPVLGILQKQEKITIERPHKLIPDKTVKETIIIKTGVLNCFVVNDTKASSIQPIIKEWVKNDSVLVSDEWKAYNGLNENYDHRIVNHCMKQYVNENNDTTNGIENAWSIFKRSIIGIYHKVSKKHLQKYADEFTFRYNSKDYGTAERFNLFLTGTNKRVTYSTLIK